MKRQTVPFGCSVYCLAHAGPRRQGNDKAGYRRCLRDTTERERLGQCREFETATVLLTNAPSGTATAQAVDLAG